MGRFSCFYGHLHSNKQKKLSQPSFETMIKMLQLDSQNHTLANSINSTTIQEFSTWENEANKLSNGSKHVSLPSRSWKYGEYHAESSADTVPFEMRNFRSLSVGCELDQRGGIFGDNNSDDCVDQGLSCDRSHDCNDNAELSLPNDPNSPETTMPDQDQEALSSKLVNHESIFSIGDPHHSEKEGHEDSDVPLYTDCADNSGSQTPPTPSHISKSYSMPNFGSRSPTSAGLSPCASEAPRNRSFENLNLLVTKKDDVSARDASNLEIAGLTKNDSFYRSEKFEGENALLDSCYDSYSYPCLSKDWVVPVPDETNAMRHDQGESSSHHWDNFPNKDFKIKRIEDWVIDLQHNTPVEETNEIGDSEDKVNRGSAFMDGLDAAKVESKLNPAMEAARRYISSLNVTATTAQLANHGLVAVPLLSAFTSLKVLNLSGNSIVRITAGALPRGLHMLNLSRNKISTIEGLRELTRVRVLDLSYNKISRIGHGLASCSSLKELYLAGNKISEVEGLHRLLKLTVLDLRFNKIATSKCLGQLAANYNSLQAISLEGNPAQKNVGDEQLKKYLLGLLPNLAYYNRQHIKTSTLKDSTDRSVRLGISAHQFDRGLRSDHKSSSSRRGGVPKRSSHSSTHGQKGHNTTDAVKLLPRGRHAPLVGTRTRSHQDHRHFDVGNKLRSLKAGFSLHKSQSEGTLAAF